MAVDFPVADIEAQHRLDVVLMHAGEEYQGPGFEHEGYTNLNIGVGKLVGGVLGVFSFWMFGRQREMSSDELSNALYMIGGTESFEESQDIIESVTPASTLSGFYGPLGLRSMRIVRVPNRAGMNDEYLFERTSRI